MGSEMCIRDSTSPEQEVGDYLLSVRNLQHHDIRFEKNHADIICDSYSNYILEKAAGDFASEPNEGGGSQSGKVKAHYRPAMVAGYGTDHTWLNRFRHSSSMSKKHSEWPAILPEYEDGSRAESYVTRHPYSKKTHPLRMQNVVTGKPEWENILRDFYFSDDPKGSFAEQLMAMEDEVRRIVHAGRKGDGVNFDRLLYKTRTDLSDRTKQLHRMTFQVEIVIFSELIA